MFYLFMSIFIVFLIMSLFFLAGKTLKWEESMASSFECGYSSYFFSRYSFSMHYFLIGLIFLFLDLELCFIMPFFNGEMSTFSAYFFLGMFILVLVLGVLLEWGYKKLEWKF